MSTTKLSGDQVLQSAYDPPTESLKVLGSFTLTGPLTISDTTSSIKVGDGMGHLLKINSDGSINVTSTGSSTVSGTVATNENPLSNFETSQYTITASAQQLTPAPLTGRSSISLRVTADPGSAVFIGKDNTVTVLTGYPLYNGDTLQMDLSTINQIWAVTDTATPIVYVLEIA